MIHVPLRRYSALAGAAALLAACSSGGASPPPAPYVPPSPAAGLVVSPASIAFRLAPATQSVVVSETGYAGAFNAGLACTPAGSAPRVVASVTPAMAKPSVAGLPVSFTVATGLLSGTCTLTISDTGGRMQSILINADIGIVAPLTVAPSSVTLASPPATSMLSAQEAGYGGNLSQFFTATSTCVPAGAGQVTTSAFSAAPGVPATFTFTALAAATCTVTIADQLAQTAQIVVTIGM